jgi:RimJ/RimL family protein N-acetyltransferase
VPDDCSSTVRNQAAVGALPSLDVLVEVADRSVHAEVRRLVPAAARQAALREELGWWLTVAAQDHAYARDFQARQPQSQAPAEAYLDRWLPAGEDLHALLGPRYRALDPERPFVAVVATSRPVTADDLPALCNLAREQFGVFGPGYLCLWTSDPPDAWEQTSNDSRLLACPLGVLRTQRSPVELSLCRATDLHYYDSYVGLYTKHSERDPAHAHRARPQTREEFAELVNGGSEWIVEIGGEPAGVVAAQDGVARGVRGACVHELVLDPAHCGRGYGPHLSVLLAQHLPHADHQFLFGTIHADNAPAYHAARRAGRIDIGGEVIATL